MVRPEDLEKAYAEFTANLTRWIPDGVIEVDLHLLQELGLLNLGDEDEATLDEFTYHFHVVETADKVTLFNEQFAIWIVPKLVSDNPTTLTLIALILPGGQCHLEIAYATSGVYNTPKYILNVLRHFLAEVLDTEAFISTIRKKEE